MCRKISTPVSAVSTLLCTALAGFASGCGAGNSNNGGSSEGSTTPWTDTAMQSLVASRCAESGCHSGAQRPNYYQISEASMRADTSALSQVTAGRMPQNGALSATELATFKKFYAQ